MHTVLLSDIQEARTRLQGITTRTRLIEFDLRAAPVSPSLRDVGTFRAQPVRRLFLKPENQQPIGAFKLAEPTTKSLPSRKPTANAASSPTPAAITRKE